MRDTKIHYLIFLQYTVKNLSKYFSSVLANKPLHGAPFKFTGCLKNKENQAYGKMASKRLEEKNTFEI